jgi:flavin reductase (DIM6/NTAB) family NADH-FMN oxidoreductase RutF
MLLICMNRSSETGRAIAESGRFVVNVLGEDHPHIAIRFASRNLDRFDAVSVTDGLHGLPLLTDAIATFECRVTETVIGGTHYVFLAEVDRAAATAGGPLTYFRGEFGRFAPPGHAAGNGRNDRHTPG